MSEKGEVACLSTDSFIEYVCAGVSRICCNNDGCFFVIDCTKNAEEIFGFKPEKDTKVMLLVTYVLKTRNTQFTVLIGRVKNNRVVYEKNAAISFHSDEQREMCVMAIDATCWENYKCDTMEERWKMQACQELYTRMDKEWDRFFNDLCRKSSKNAVNHSYEKVFKEDILLCFEEENYIASYFTVEQLHLLLQLSDPLDFLYNEWLGTDVTYMENLRESITRFSA